MKMKSLSRVRLLETPRTAAYQAPASMGFSRQEYWSGVPSPSPQADELSLKENRALAMFVCHSAPLGSTVAVLAKIK